MKHATKAAAVLALVTCGAGFGNAANKSAPFNSRILINSGCTISVNDLVFAPTTLLTGTEITNSTISIRCTKGTFWVFSFSSTALAASATGTMTGVTAGNTDTVNYSMTFQGTPFATGTGAVQAFNMRGRITSTGARQADNYAQARTIYVFY